VKRVLKPAATSDRIKVRGADDLMVFRARCCNPIRGEKIVGYITRGKGVSVHSATCPNVVNLSTTPSGASRSSGTGHRQRPVHRAPDDARRGSQGHAGGVELRVADINTNITNLEAPPAATRCTRGQHDRGDPGPEAPREGDQVTAEGGVIDVERGRSTSVGTAITATASISTRHVARQPRHFHGGARRVGLAVK
jgi:hypothetical protein